MYRIILDAMGGDNAPKAIIDGARLALDRFSDVFITFVGKKEVIERFLSDDMPKDRFEIVNAREEIEMAEPPVAAIRKKKDSSLVVGMQLVADGRGDVFLTAGSTGATIAGATMIVRRAKGVERPALAPILPTTGKGILLVDCGANIDCKPVYLQQFAIMGSIYMETIMGIKNPRVGLINNGAEEEKGNALVKETFPLLKACEDINFVGSIEAREIPKGEADVIVCEAFVGNVILKLYEGLSSTLIGAIKKGMMSTLKSKIGAALALPALKSTLKTFDATQYGGAPLLGLNGLVVKTHGSAKAKEITNSIFQCVTFKEEDINGKIRKNIVSSAEQEGM